MFEGHLTVRVTEHWNGLLRHVVECPSLEIHPHLDIILHSVLCVILLSRGLGQLIFRAPFQPQPLCYCVIGLENAQQKAFASLSTVNIQN